MTSQKSDEAYRMCCKLKHRPKHVTIRMIKEDFEKFQKGEEFDLFYAGRATPSFRCRTNIEPDAPSLPKSPLHNPFKLSNPKKKYKTRDPKRLRSLKAVVLKFEEHLESNSELLEYLPKLKGKAIICWCEPGNLCHTDILVKKINNLVD